jgi:hypothetical protein
MEVQGLLTTSSDQAMDKHRAHVVAAADAVRNWVVAQRAVSWSLDSLDARSPVHTVALPRPVVVPWPVAAPGPEFTPDPATSPGSPGMPSPPASVLPFPAPAQPWPATADLEADVLVPEAIATTMSADAPTVTMVPPATPQVGTDSRIGQLAGALGILTSHAGPALRWTARAALVTGFAAAVVWAVRAYRAPASPTAVVPTVTVDTGAAVASVTSKPVVPEPPAKRTGRLQIDSDPSGAVVLVDGKERGTTPLAVDDLPVGSHVVVFKSPKGTVQQTATVTENRTTQVNEGIYSGWLHVSSPIELRISTGSKTVRLDDANQAMLPPGSHTLTLANRPLNFEVTRTVLITPGGTTSVTIEPATAPLSITASEPAQVSIDGDIIGEAPITDHLANIGVRDVTARSASGQIRHATVTLPTEGARVDIDFSKP